jgi:ABC-type transporter Mla subunit MlaD
MLLFLLLPTSCRLLHVVCFLLPLLPVFVFVFVFVVVVVVVVVVAAAVFMAGSRVWTFSYGLQLSFPQATGCYAVS